jgi:hypothetical protein
MPTHFWENGDYLCTTDKGKLQTETIHSFLSDCSEINYTFMLVLLRGFRTSWLKSPLDFRPVEKPCYSGAMPTFFALLSHKLTSPIL